MDMGSTTDDSSMSSMSDDSMSSMTSMSSMSMDSMMMNMSNCDCESMSSTMDSMMDMMDSMSMSMDSMSMDSMSMSMSMDMECPMNMYFHHSNEACVLFKSWKTSNAAELTLACFAVILFGILREFFLYVGKYHELARKYNEKIPFWFHCDRLVNDTEAGLADAQKRVKSVSAAGANDIEDGKNARLNTGTDGDGDNGSDSDNCKCYERYLTAKKGLSGNFIDDDEWCIVDYIIDTSTFLCAILFGYALMLIFMTYNCGLCIATMIGFGLGRLIFYRKFRSLRRFIRLHSCPNTKCIKKQGSVAIEAQALKATEEVNYTKGSDDCCNTGI